MTRTFPEIYIKCVTATNKKQNTGTSNHVTYLPRYKLRGYVTTAGRISFFMYP
jgi:hypothetical protein